MRTLAVLVVLVFLGVPALAAAPSGCVPQCEVPSAESGYVPPATVVPSGSNVTWSSLDRAHTATEPGVPASQACVNVLYGPAPGHARFAIHNGSLWAQQPLQLEKRCSTASLQRDGSWLLEYHCLYHSQMVGFLLVRPEASP